MIETYSFRLRPGDDLLAGLIKFISDRQIRAGCVITCVGSLTVAVLRLANREEYSTFEGYFEIVSLTGTLSIHSSHLHISISDTDGRTIGGHLVEGCKVYTTAEIVIGAFPDLVYTRQPCEFSGYDELVVQSA